MFCFGLGFFFLEKYWAFVPVRFKPTWKVKCAIFFLFLKSSMWQPVKTGFPHIVISTVYASILKWGWRAWGEGRRETQRKQKEEGEKEEQWGRKGVHLEDFFLLLNSDTRKLCVHGCPFSLAEAWRQTEMLCQLQRKSMKMLFGSPFHHSARMVSFTL